jgi:hypothetical protein
MPPLVRGIAREHGKRVELETSGGDVELDRSIIESIADPMTHMLRNALDHGLEDPQGRAVLGKSEVGRVWVSAYHECGRVVMEVRDDGRGIDPERVKESAIARGAITREQAALLSEKDAIALIFEPGFSTAKRSATFPVAAWHGRRAPQHPGAARHGRTRLEARRGHGGAHPPAADAGDHPSLIVSVANERFSAGVTWSGRAPQVRGPAGGRPHHQVPPARHAATAGAARAVPGHPRGRGQSARAP